MSISDIKLLEKLDKKKEHLIKEAEDFTNKYMHTGLTHNQINLILGIANEATSIKEVINFLRYQIARDEKSRNWGKKNIGENLIEKLKEIYKKPTSEGDLKEQQKNELGMEMVRYFLGYFSRESRYWELKNKKEGKDESGDSR